MEKSLLKRGNQNMSKYTIIALMEAVKIISELVDSPDQVKQAAEQIQESVRGKPRTEQKEKTAQSCSFEQSKQNPD